MSTPPDADYDIVQELSGPALPGHVYVHVPFCASRCDYCDFYSIVDELHEHTVTYVAAATSEAYRWASRGLPGVLETLYIGGGTPTVLGGQLIRLVTDILERFPVRKAAEVTVEGNPDTLHAGLVDPLAAAGVTRVSVGVQSFDDRDLRLLGRRHDAAKAEAACAAVRAAGLQLSVDLMCGVPGQTPSVWIDTLERAIATGAGHVSVYPLSVEEGTPLAAAIDTGLVAAPDPDMAADMLLAAETLLERAGIIRYEVANYARPGEESRHNTAYWTGRPYLGIGPSAHGMLDPATAQWANFIGAPDGVARVRYANVRDVERWFMGESPEIETLDAGQSAREDIMLGLRLVAGVSRVTVDHAGLTPVLESLRDQGLVELAAERWRTTTRGWLLGNEVFGRVWAGE